MYQLNRLRLVPRFLLAGLAWQLATTPATAANLRGQVVNRVGEPVAGVTVEVRPMPSRYAVLTGETPPPTVARTTSDPDGLYTFELPEVGVFELRLSLAGHQPLVLAPQPLVGDDVGLPPAILDPLAEDEARVRGIEDSGASLSGACLWVEAAGPLTGWRAAPRRVATDDQGWASVPRAVGEELRWVAERAGVVLQGRGLGLDTAQVTVESSWVARDLRLVDRQGEGLPDVVVSFPGSPCAIAVSDLEGRVRIALPMDRRSRLELWSPEGWSQLLELGAPRPTRRTDPLQPIEPSVVETERSWTGQVRSQDGRPLAGALVVSAADPGRWARSDARGRWTLGATAQPEAHVELHAGGFLSHRLDVVTARDRDPIVSVLEPARVLSGTVVDTAGLPVAGVAIAGVTIATWPLTPEPRARWAYTDAAGSFSLPRLDAERDLRLLASHRSYAPREVVTRPRPGLAIELGPRRLAFGHVLDARERAIAGAQVVVIRAGKPSPVLETDADGRFALDHLDPGWIDLMANGPLHSELRVRGIEVGAGKGPVDLGTLVLADGLELAGRVVGSHEQGLEGVWVEITDPRGSRRQVVSGVRGGFRFEGLNEGIWNLRASSEHHAAEHVVGIRLPREAPVVVRLDPSVQLVGRVLEEEGEPVVGARVEIVPWRPSGRIGPRARGTGRELSTDEAGRFSASGFHAGRYQVRGSGEGFRPSPWQELEFVANGEAKDVEIYLEAGAVLRGALRNDRGEPLSDRLLFLGDSQATTDSDGRFLLDGLASGPGTLEMRDPRSKRHRWPVDVTADMEPLDLVVPAGRELHGTVESVGGLAVEGAEVELTRPDQGGRSVARVQSDSEGRFAVDGLGDGRYRLIARHPDHGPGWLQVVLDPTEAAPEPRLVLESTTLLSGQLSGLEDEERAQARVRAEHPELGSTRGAVDYQGQYRIEGLASGPWRIVVETSDGRRQVSAHLRLQGEPEKRHDLHFAGLDLVGAVLLAGEPLAAARIALRSPDRSTVRNVRTDIAGEFAFEDLPPGRYWLDVVAPRLAVTHVEPIELAEDRVLTVELEPGTITGRVTDTGGEPVSGARLRFTRQLRDGTEGPITAFQTDETGGFRVDNAMPGSYHVSVRHPGHQLAEQDFELGSGEAEWLEIGLPVASVLVLRPWIRDRTLDAVTVSLLAPDGRIATTTGQPVDASGMAVFDTLPEGDLDLLVSAPGAAPRPLRVSIPGPEVEVELAPASRIDLAVPWLAETEVAAWARVLTADGRPAAFFDARALHRDRWPVSQGRTTVGELPGGQWLLRVETSEGAFWETPVATAVGERSALVIDGAPQGPGR